jgi:putative ABC transport system permease protein
MKALSQVARIALRGLGARKGRAALMMAGVAIGILTLTLVVAVTRGISAKVEKGIQAFGPDAIMVAAGSPQTRGPGDERVTTLLPEDLVALRDQVPGVRVAAPMVTRTSQTIVRGDRNTTAVVFGSTPEYEEAWDWHAESGEWVSEAHEASLARVAVLGKTVARDLFSEEDPVGQMIRIGDQRFKVIGVASQRGASPHGTDMDNRVVVPLSTAMRRLYNVTYYSMVRLRVKPGVDADQASVAVTTLMRQRHHIVAGKTDDFAVRSPSTMRQMAATMAGTLTLLLGIITVVALGAGALVLGNIMLVAVSERRAEIGLRRAMGATRVQIAQQFLVEGMIVTVLGGAAGVVLGTLAALVLGRLKVLPALVSWQPFALALGVSLLVGALASLVPARRAAAVAIADALRP